MRTALGVLLIIFNVTIITDAFAAGMTIRTDTAGELADACSAKEQAKVTFCQGFAQGAISLKLREAGDTKPFCFPNPAPKRAATRIIAARTNRWPPRRKTCSKRPVLSCGARVVSLRGHRPGTEQSRRHAD